MGKNTVKVREKSWNFVSPEKLESCKRILNFHVTLAPSGSGIMTNLCLRLKLSQESVLAGGGGGYVESRGHIFGGRNCSS